MFLSDFAQFLHKQYTADVQNMQDIPEYLFSKSIKNMFEIGHLYT